MNKSTLLIVLLVFTLPAMAYIDIGDDVVISTFSYYEGNLLLKNEGHVPFMIFYNNSTGYLRFVGEIQPDQGIYLNESLNYSLYANYDECRDFTDVEIVKKRFNQWWLIVIVAIMIIVIIIKIYKVIT